MLSPAAFLTAHLPLNFNGNGADLLQKTGEVFALKQMQKSRIVRTGQKRNVLNEKAVLMRCNHPYVGASELFSPTATSHSPPSFLSTLSFSNSSLPLSCFSLVQIIRLVKTFKDKNCLYMLVEFLQGGDMFGLLAREGGRFNSQTARHYAGIGEYRCAAAHSPPLSVKAWCTCVSFLVSLCALQ